jgi:hypothetical protein
MAMNRYWALPLALAGGVAIGAAFAMQRRTGRQRAGRQQHKQDLHTWEGEGGSLATPAAGQHRP